MLHSVRLTASLFFAVCAVLLLTTASTATAALKTKTSVLLNTQVASTPPTQDAPRSSLDFRVYTNWCEADQNQSENWQVQLGYCLGYLQGLYWGQVIASDDSERPFCLPANVSKAAMVEALDSYARANSKRVQSASMSAGETARHVAGAFRTYFSCP